MPAAAAFNTSVVALRLAAGPSIRSPNDRRLAGREPIYFAGPENRLVAEAVARLIAVRETAGAAYPGLCPLTLIGGVACGKSLIAAGVAAAWVERWGNEAVLSTTGVDLRRRLERTFAQERNHPGGVAELERRLAVVRLLVLEDLEGVAESPATIELLTRVCDRLTAAGGAILVTVGKPLGEVAGLTTQLVGRLTAGLTLTINTPGDAARAALLDATLRARGGRLEGSALKELAAWLPADARRVTAVADALVDRFGVRAPMTLGQVRAYIAEESAEQASTPLAEIAPLVARYYRMPLRTLKSSSRKAPVVLARAVTIYLARQLTPLSYDEIGRYLGGRDHTTVMHSHKRIEQRMPTDRALQSAIAELLTKLGRSDLAGVDPLLELGRGDAS